MLDFVDGLNIKLWHHHHHQLGAAWPGHPFIHTRFYCRSILVHVWVKHVCTWCHRVVCSTTKDSFLNDSVILFIYTLPTTTNFMNFLTVQFLLRHWDILLLILLLTKTQISSTSSWHASNWTKMMVQEQSRALSSVRVISPPNFNEGEPNETLQEHHHHYSSDWHRHVL